MNIGLSYDGPNEESLRLTDAERSGCEHLAESFGLERYFLGSTERLLGKTVKHYEDSEGPVKSEGRFISRSFVEVLAGECRHAITAAIKRVEACRSDELALEVAKNADTRKPNMGLEIVEWEFPQCKTQDEKLVSLLAVVKWVRAQEEGLRQRAEKSRKRKDG